MRKIFWIVGFVFEGVFVDDEEVFDDLVKVSECGYGIVWFFVCFGIGFGIDNEGFVVIDFG